MAARSPLRHGDSLKSNADEILAQQIADMLSALDAMDQSSGAIKLSSSVQTAIAEAIRLAN